MKNETLYNKTVDILVQAYFNDTLISGVCEACAVGNLIASNNGYKIEILNGEAQWFNKGNYPLEPTWKSVFVSNATEYFWGLFRSVQQDVNLRNYTGGTRKEIDSTGYTVQELALIERAFEKGYRGLGDRMFNALMSVVNCLDQIHENTDPVAAEQTKRKFNKTLTNKVTKLN